ncbi:MAG: hypothetical protein ACYTGZ_02525 [Planctomycetota bacterium]|jgi:hypothetical protein
MMRVWLTSFVVVAAVVAAVLYFTRDDGKQDGDTNGGAVPTEPQRLDDEAVRTYLKVQPQIFAVIERSIQNPELAARNREEIEVVLRNNQLTDESWDGIWRRVEDVVNTIRMEGRRPARVKKLQEQIDLKEAAIRGSDGKLKEQLEEDLKKLIELRDRVHLRVHPADEAIIDHLRVHPADEAIIDRYWTDLNALVPAVR